MKYIRIIGCIIILILLTGCSETEFDESKVFKYEDWATWYSEKEKMVKENALIMHGSEDDLFVDNLVTVKATKEITFDTSSVVKAILLKGNEYKYYIQYQSVESAQKAVKKLEKNNSVVYACVDSIISLDD